jgi:hypothetical protein
MNIFNPQPKTIYVRDAKYMREICKRYKCVITGRQGIPHHLIGYKQGNKKVSDHLTFCLSDEYHSATYETGLHKDFKKWEEMHNTQIHYIKETLLMAAMDCIISKQDFEIAYQQCKDLDLKFN